MPVDGRGLAVRSCPPLASLPARAPSLRLVAALILCASLLLSACGDDTPDPNAPDGVLHLFIQSIPDNKPDDFWNYLDRDTKLLFRDYLKMLVELDTLINTHFASDPEEQLRLRAQTGVSNILRRLRQEAAKRPKGEQLPTGKDLFLTLVRLPSGDFKDDHREGAKADEVEIAENKETATVTTKSGQVYNMVFDPTAKAWRVARSSPAFLIADPVTRTDKTNEIRPDGSQRELMIVQCASGLTYYMNEQDGSWQVEGASGAFLRDEDGSQVVIIDIFAQALIPLQNSQKALEQLTEERMSEERTRRERVIKIFDESIQANPTGGQP